MADKVTSSKVLKMNLKFADNDTRTLDLDDPVDSISKDDINAFGDVIKSTKMLIGDKGGADFTFIDTAKVVELQRTQLDLR